MSRGPPHRYIPGDERSFRGYPQRYGEFSGSSSYGYYGGPPYKRQRRLSDEDVGPPSGANYGPATYYDPPYVRHQEVGLGDYNDFSSISDKDIKMEREGSKKEFEKSELQTKKWQTSSEGSGYSTSAPSSPHSRVSPKISPRLSPRVGPTTPPCSTSQLTLVPVSSSGQDQSKASSPSFSDEAASFSRHPSLQVVCTTSSSQSLKMYGAAVHEKIRDSTGQPALISPSASGPQKDFYLGPTIEAVSPSAPGSEGQSEEKKAMTEDTSDLMSKDELLRGMEKVDSEITQVEQQINNLKKKQKQLEEEASKQPSEPPEEELPPPKPKPKSIIQKIYEENKKKAETAEARLVKLSLPLPGGKNRQLCKEYKTLKLAWLKKIERNENNPRRKQKETKLREIYEKVFPEIRKQREQTERFASVLTITDNANIRELHNEDYLKKIWGR
ncbi:nuclear receptor corepressor 1-like [Stylophora pistillata]|uniref:nuclear receptor corepressor 1-like n=1 Tax=Stylophora pistillata TaxID=50429 RepID=UPI000C043243|nr:nuclear receptor corepressor 1-like [Stylophora pistillata]